MRLLQERKPSPHLEYRADIDGLRAIAVLSVVGYHAFPEWIGGGFVGVDIFFVISGFLISGIIFHGMENGCFSYGDFYIRRIKRIFPALILVLLASLAADWFILTGDEYKQLGKHIAGGAGFIANFVLWNESGYFGNEAETKPLLHLWSLGIEEQFYIIWPLLLGISWRRKWNFLLLTLLVAVASFALNIATISNHPVAAFYSPLCRFWELMLGGILAYLTLHRSEYLPGKAHWQSVFGLILIALSIVLLNKERTFPGWWALLPGIAAILIISAGSEAWLNRKLFGNSFLVRIGLISYPLYLWHWLLLSFAHIIGSRVPSISIRVMMVAISFWLAGVTYEIVEKPIRFGKGNNAVKAFILCLCMAVIGYLGYNASQRSGPSDIVLTSLLRHLSTQKPADAGDSYALNLKKYEGLLKSEPDYIGRLNSDRLVEIRESNCYLHYSDHKTFEHVKPQISHCLALVPGKKNVLIIGDSHAADLYIALAHTHGQFNFLQSAGDGCNPKSLLTRNDVQWANTCEALRGHAINFAKEHKLDAVILAGWWRPGYTDVAFDIASLNAAGQKVILVGPPLEYSSAVHTIIARRQSDNGFRHYMDSFIMKDSIALSQNMKTFARANSISFIDRIEYYCKSGCPVMNKDGQLLFIDSAHLSVAGAMFLGDQLLGENVLQRIIDSPVPLQLPEGSYQH